MVCEEPRRRRQLVVSRRGSFFEDPFFRDAWDDYSSAVRSIVDRFNRGLVAPQRLQDSQCHSFYRTLRTARQSYSTHSARFKDEGHAYKLIMDVQEFIGGDITVRTAGRTVSVRGKVEVGGDERKKKPSEVDDDTHSTVSGLSSSTKTLHRRFTLPPDADNEKVESSLSKDAVLTVTIPKKTGVHIIPVRLDDDDNLMEHSDDRQPVGLKRPSDAQPDRHCKRSQDGVSTGRRKTRSKRDEEKEKRRNKSERNPRPGSANEGNHPTKFRDAFRVSQRTETSRDSDPKPTNGHRRSRREKKYEDVQEVNIPVRLLDDTTPPKSHQHQYEPKIRHIEIARDFKTIADGHHRIDSEQRYLHLNGDKSERRKSEGVLIDESHRKSSRRRSYPEGTLDQVDGNQLKLKSQKRKEIKPIFELNDTDEEKNNQELDSPNKENLRIQKVEHEKSYKTKYQVETAAPLVTNDKLTFDTPFIDIKTNEYEKEINYSKPQLQKEELNEANVPSQVNGTSSCIRDSLEAPRLSSQRPSSPVSPGSRLVKVEEDSSLKEDSIFKDCWNDFSNTLQDVLARLQELSSELGQFKALPTTPTSEPSGPEEEGQSSESPAEGRSTSRSSEPTRIVADGVPSPTSKSTPAHSETSGVGEREGGPNDESGSVFSPWKTGHGPSVAYDLDARRKSDALEGDVLEDEITTVAPKELSPLVTELSAQKGSNEVPQGVFPIRRPATLPLRDLARPLREAHIQENPPASPAIPTLLGNQNPPGSFLETLRKNSPVEALQESFHRSDQPHVECTGGRFVPMEVTGVVAGPVGGRGKGEERSCPPSPIESQSSAGSDWSESVSTAESESSANKFALKTHEDALNDLSRPQSLTNSVLDLEHRGLSYAPNIDASPESNLTSDEGDDEGSPPSPTQRLKKAPYTPGAPFPDVTASVGSANARRPEIPSDDAMGCERPLVPSARVPLVGAKRFSRANKPCDLLLDDRGDAERGRESDGSMGAVLSRGRRGPSSTATNSPSGSPLGTRSPSTASPSSPGRRMRPQASATHQENPSAVPSYVRTRVDAPKRSTGFSHVHSDNVRKMRDMWGTKQDLKAPGQLRPEKAAASPSTTAPGRCSDGSRSPRVSQSPSSRPHSVPHSDRRTNSFQSTPSPSPKGGTPNSSPRCPASRYMKENSPARTNGHYSKPPSSPLCESRRSSLSNSKRGSAPPSPITKCHRDSKESPLPSPMAQKNSRENTRFSFDKQRRDSHSKAAAHKDRRSPPVEESPRSSKVHQRIFKRLRDGNLQPGSEAICFKEETDRYKMIMDVEEFVPGEIEVLQDDRLLTVKGRVETRNSTGQRSVRTFERTFDIPSNSREEDIDSALSKDGILTIFVPKKKERIIKIELVD